MSKAIQIFLILFCCFGLNYKLQAQNIVVEANISTLRLSDGGDCVSSADPRIFARVSTSASAWSNQWSFQTDDVGTTTGSCGMTCNAGSCGSCGFGNQATWNSGAIPYTSTFQVNINGYESDGAVCVNDDGNCGGYSGFPYEVNNDITSNYAPACANTFNVSSTASRFCNGNGNAQTYFAGWNMRYYWTGLTDANAGGTISFSNIANYQICAGGSISQLNGNTLLSNRFSARQWQYSYNGGAYISISGATGQNYTPAAGFFASAGTYNFRRLLSYCSDFSGNSTTVSSNVLCVVAYPTAVTISDPTNRCFGVTVTQPTVSNVTSFTTQWSIDNGAYGAWAAPTTVGCHTITTRYALTSTCGSNTAGSAGPTAGCIESNDVNVVIFPLLPVLSDAAAVCAGTAFTLPTITNYSANGFTTQWSINGAAYTATPIIPTTSGCHSINARYVTTAACGSTPAGTTGPAAACLNSTTTRYALTFPAAPSITAPSNVCVGTSITLPNITITSFTTQWSVNGATYTATPTLPTTAGCHTFRARYVSTATCGSTLAGATAPSGCIESNEVSVTIFPTRPTLIAPTNVCEGTAFTLPTVTSVAGFTTQYSINGGIFSTSPTVPTTPGCHSIVARYVLTSACGNSLANSTAPSSCLESTSVNVVTFPTAPVITTPSNTCAGTAFSLPSVPAVSGFTVQFSINGGAFSTSPTIPTAAGTYSIVARYVLTSACGSTPANTAGSGLCGNSNSVNATIDPSPTATPTSQLFTCDNTATLNATSITSGATVAWQYVSGSVSPTGTSTSNPLLITFSGPSTAVYNLLVSRGACNNINVGSASVTLPTTSTTTIATTASCGLCVVTDGNSRIFYNSSGQIIGRIEDDPIVSPAQLNLTEMCTRINGSVQTVMDNVGNLQPYLQRQWTVTPANNTNAKVTLYFTNAELTALQAAAFSTIYQFSGYDLWVTKYPGGSGGTFTNPGSLNGEYVPASYSTYGSNHKVEMDVSTYSTFYIHPALFPFSALPVELTSFTGWNQGAVNKLQWITASEENTLKYEIQKSISNEDWSTIGEKVAAGNSTQQLNYDFDDNNPVIGNNYYRLKMIDIDGKFTFSNTINIPISEAVLNDFTRIYPNPTDGQLNVELQATTSFETKLTAYDIVGKKAFEKTVAINKGLNTVKLDFTTLAKGTYVLQFADVTGKIHTTKFVKD